jgi:hypothetical protein
MQLGNPTTGSLLVANTETAVGFQCRVGSGLPVLRQHCWRKTGPIFISVLVQRWLPELGLQWLPVPYQC